MTVMMPDNPERKPYNSDPMDQPAPEVNFKRWLAEMVRYVERDPGPPLSWDDIQNAAHVETEARLIEFSFQKNYRAVDAILENRYRNYPDDLLLETQGYTAKTHPLEVESDAEYAARTKEP